MPFGIRPNRAVELPPPGWEKLGRHPTWTEREFDDLDALIAYCGSAPLRRAGDEYVMACAHVGDRVVALPSAKAWPNRGERERLKPHEYGHTWSLKHAPGPTGREQWLMPDGTPAKPLSDKDVENLLKWAREAAGYARGGLVEPSPLQSSSDMLTDMDDMQPEYGLAYRAQRAGADLAEALSLLRAPLAGGQPAPPPAPMPPPRPAGAPAQGAPAMPGRREAISPLQMTQSFKSPPMAAALQGAVGREGPVGFARGGFAVFGED